MFLRSEQTLSTVDGSVNYSLSRASVAQLTPEDQDLVPLVRLENLNLPCLLDLG